MGSCVGTGSAVRASERVVRMGAKVRATVASHLVLGASSTRTLPPPSQSQDERVKSHTNDIRTIDTNSRTSLSVYGNISRFESPVPNEEEPKKRITAYLPAHQAAKGLSRHQLQRFSQVWSLEARK